MHCFRECTGFYGELKLPSNLTYIGKLAFYQCKNLTGDLEIPQGVTEINEACFKECGFNGLLSLHDGITGIGLEAFRSTPLKVN